MRAILILLGSLLACPDIEVNLQTNDTITALIVAANNGHSDIVKFLLAHPDIQVNLQSRDKFTALTAATHKGHSDIVKLLLERPDIQVDVQNQYKRTALDIAIANNYVEIIDLLQTYNKRMVCNFLMKRSNIQLKRANEDIL